MAENPNILVVGSINVDLVVRATRMPSPGETLLGHEFITSPGGKGANQAVGVSRLGGNCRMIGIVGNDAFGEQALANLKTEGVDCDHVATADGAATGVAIIIVDSNGENSIVVAGGANHELVPDDVFAEAAAFEQADVVLLQLELPLPTVRAAMDVARRHGCKVILDPAPARSDLSDEVLRVDIISPNVTEAEILTGQKAHEERVAKTVALDLISRGAQAAVLKLGSRGSMVVAADGHFYLIPPYKVDVVDTTAAGDAFTAALALAVGRGQKLHQAATFATAAGALACTKLGAQSAMPSADDVTILMQDQPR